MFDKFKKILTPLLIILLLLSIVVMGAPTYVNVGPTTDFEGDVGVPDGSGYYISDVLFSTLGLIDISTLAKTDGGVIVGDGTNFVLETGITARTSLGLGNVENLKVKLDATTAPGVSNDNTEGYAVGSRWVDTTADKEYVALDVSTEAAVWTETTGAGNGGYTNLTQFIDQTAWRIFYSNADGDVIELPLGVDGTFLGSNGVAVAPSFETPTGAGDMLKATYDTDEDGIVDKSETVDDGVGNSSTAADVKDAVTKKHTSGNETCVGDVSGTVGANTVDKIKGHTVDETAIGDDKILVYKTTGTKFVYEAKPAAGSTTFLGLTDTPASYAGKAGEILRVAVDPPGVEFSGVGIETTLTVDSDAKVPTSKAVNDFCETTQGYPNTDAEIKAILVDEVTKTGAFTAGKIVKINNATGIIEEGTNTDTEVADAVTKKHTQNTDTSLDMYNALTSDHNYSGLTDYQVVGESVVFGDLLYFNWTTKKWKKTNADAAATMPGLRIALEDKTDGQDCLMLVKGYIRDDSAFEFAGAMIYASITPGAVSSTAPTEAGDQLQRVGVAKSADILFFDPSIDVGEIKP